MNKIMNKSVDLTIVLVAMLLLLFPTSSQATIDGISGTIFNFTAREGHIITGEGGSLLFWGYKNGNRRVQYPGPTLIVNQGDTVTVNLKTHPSVRMPVSIVFPGQEGVTATGGISGLLTREAPPNGITTVTYTFVAAHAGTYLYHSGTRPDLQVEMGLLGAIIVRPSGFNPSAPTAYNHEDSAYDQEYLFLLSEMDPRIHELVEVFGIGALVDTDYLSDYFPNYWFINGRNAPDTMVRAYARWLPYQPYNCMPMIYPGDKMLMRVINAGRDLHPFHHHGNHSRVIAKDGRFLESAPLAGADLSYEVFTIQAIPGETVDAIFDWTGKGLKWDIYGDPNDPEFVHTCNGDPVNPSPGFDPVSHEYCPDHGKPFPVALPQDQELTFGAFYSGSPFLGVLGSLPPGEGGFNPNAGFVYMWHSHSEKEMTNYDIFPGGMMTMMIVVPHGSMMP